MPRYLLHLSFCGTNYNGWQVQENSKSVQSEIDQRITQLFSEPVLSVGCGRTDTGVHASNFILHFDLTREISVDDLKFKLNRMLPPDIVVYHAFEVEKDFHARFDALSRTYHYFISKERNPFLTNLSWHIHYRLNIQAMNETIQILKEYEDFSSFSKSKTQVKTNLCTIHEVNWKETADFYIFSIKANRFLRNMVRAIVGTSLQIGLNKLDEKGLRAIVEGKDRRLAFESVPGTGLYLTQIEYPTTKFKGNNLQFQGIPFDPMN